MSFMLREQVQLVTGLRKRACGDLGNQAVVAVDHSRYSKTYLKEFVVCMS